MFDFGDGLTIESYRIPWLIWIQLIVMVLLIFLIYCFSIFALDHSNTTASSTPSTSQLVVPNETQKPLPKNSTTTIITDCLQTSQVGEQVLKGEIAISTSRRLVRGGEDITEMEGFSEPHLYHHPCHYFRMARVAFLKCLGLDEHSSTPEQRRRKDQRKRKES